MRFLTLVKASLVTALLASAVPARAQGPADMRGVPLVCKMVSWVDNKLSDALYLVPGEQSLVVGHYLFSTAMNDQFRSFRISKVTTPNQLIAVASDQYQRTKFILDSDYATAVCSPDLQVVDSELMFLTGKRTVTPITLSKTTKAVHIVTHPTKDFDDGLSKRGLEKLRKVLSKKKIQSVMLTHLAKTDKNYYLKESDVARSIYSPGGAHEIRITNPDTSVILSGGFIDLCMCETFRDLVRNIQPRHRLDFLIPMEATTTSRISDFARGSMQESEASLLSDLIPKAESSEIMSFVSSKIWGASDEGDVPAGFLCSFQNSRRPIDAVASADYTLTVLVAKRSLGSVSYSVVGTIGNGPKAVRLIFAPVSLVSKIIR